MEKIISIIKTKTFVIVFLFSIFIFTLGFTEVKYYFPFSSWIISILIPSGYILFIYLQSEKNVIKLNDINNHINIVIETSYIDDILEITKNLNEINTEDSNIITHMHYKRIYDTTSTILKRVKREIDDSRKRANINLIIGVLLTALGFLILINNINVYEFKASDANAHFNGETFYGYSIKELILTIILNFSLVLFVEIFSFFFLKLYKNGLEEIRYFQNELTNIESKLVALEVAYISKNEKLLEISINTLSQTERNFILKKGETTVELERAKSESENMQNILKAVPEFFKNKGK